LAEGDAGGVASALSADFRFDVRADVGRKYSLATRSSLCTLLELSVSPSQTESKTPFMLDQLRWLVVIVVCTCCALGGFGSCCFFLAHAVQTRGAQALVLPDGAPEELLKKVRFDTQLTGEVPGPTSGASATGIYGIYDDEEPQNALLPLGQPLVIRMTGPRGDDTNWTGEGEVIITDGPKDLIGKSLKAFAKNQRPFGETIIVRRKAEWRQTKPTGKPGNHIVPILRVPLPLENEHLYSEIRGTITFRAEFPIQVTYDNFVKDENSVERPFVITVVSEADLKYIDNLNKAIQKSKFGWGQPFLIAMAVCLVLFIGTPLLMLWGMKPK
jgi:hypothetical protein